MRSFGSPASRALRASAWAIDALRTRSMSRSTNRPDDAIMKAPRRNSGISVRMLARMPKASPMAPAMMMNGAPPRANSPPAVNPRARTLGGMQSDRTA